MIKAKKKGKRKTGYCHFTDRSCRLGYTYSSQQTSPNLWVEEGVWPSLRKKKEKGKLNFNISVNISKIKCLSRYGRANPGDRKGKTRSSPSS